jgi:hypothetical protein
MDNQFEGIPCQSNPQPLFPPKPPVPWYYKLLAGIGHTLLVTYYLGILITTPYAWYRYAQTHSFLSTLCFGSWLGGLKALVWPLTW